MLLTGDPGTAGCGELRCGALLLDGLLAGDAGAGQVLCWLEQAGRQNGADRIPEHRTHLPRGAGTVCPVLRRTDGMVCRE